MTYVRAKKINGKTYFYLVKSIRINGKIRQKVVKYIGKPKNIVSLIKNARQK